MCFSHDWERVKEGEEKEGKREELSGQFDRGVLQLQSPEAEADKGPHHTGAVQKGKLCLVEISDIASSTSIKYSGPCPSICSKGRLGKLWIF